jgi:AcrR family transcriptional regulator
MATEEPRTLPPGVRRAQILDAAAAVLTERGARATTVDRVAELAGVAKGTVYLHFESKDALFGALRARYEEDLLNAAGEELGATGSPRRRLEGFLRRAISLHRRRAELHHVLFHEVGGSEDASLGRFRALFAGFVEDCVRAGVFDVDDVEIAAALLLHGLRGMVVEFVHAERGDEDAAIAATVSLVLGGLRGSAT